MNRPNSPMGAGGKAGGLRIFILISALAILGYLVFRQFKGASNFVSEPQKVQLTYVPADFVSNVDIESALPILANPYRYEREFYQLVHDFNLNMLSHVANRMNLSDSLKLLLPQFYEEQHPYFAKMIFKDYVAMTDSTSALYATWYQSEYSNAVDVFNEVASKYTCFVVNNTLSKLIQTEEGAIDVNGTAATTPCGVALLEGLAPTIKRLKEKAARQDFERSKGILQERVEKAIAELATMEVRDRKGIGASKTTKFMGVDVSSTEMEMTAISIMKVGFKLDKQFEISLNDKAGLVIVTMPEPEILSHEVFPRIDKLDIGWLREIDQSDFNKNMDLLRREFRTDALRSDVMSKAKQRAADLMDAMLTPVVKSLNPRYAVKVRFIHIGGEEREELPLGTGERPVSASVFEN
ncbi:MAG: hypothetical protein CMN32_13305 [Saprospirales bacterium]|nr:hypothetical protein [Saprospirales bacterium]